MHTLVISSAGFMMLALFAGIAARKGAALCAPIILLFVPVWLLVCLIDLCLGVVQAGHRLIDELGIHSFVFGAPAVAALLLVRRPSPKP